MKIVTPLSNKDSYEVLVEAGASEFYCGYLPSKWLKKYSNIMPINRRELLLGYHNITENCSMKIIRKMIERYQVPVKIAFNSHYYMPEQYPLLLSIVKELLDIGFDTFIFSDIAFIVYLREKGINCKINISGDMEICNNYSINFVNQMDISRVIFPRKVDLNTMKDCIGNSNINGMEYEAFMLNALCLYSGGFCNSIHTDEIPVICDIPFRAGIFNKNSDQFNKYNNSITKMVDIKNQNQQKKQDPSINQNDSNYRIGSSGCGLCRIKEMMNIGVTHVKIVGRGTSLNNLISDIKITKNIIRLAENTDGIDGISKKIKSELFNNSCTYLCYYPSELST